MEPQQSSSSSTTTPIRRSPRRCGSSSAYKGLPWQSVSVPRIMPKPDVVELTGGYRRTPFAQIGADIYCDTALICDLLESTAARAEPVSRWHRGPRAHAGPVGGRQPVLVDHGLLLPAGRPGGDLRRRAARHGQGLRRGPREDARRRGAPAHADRDGAVPQWPRLAGAASFAGRIPVGRRALPGRLFGLPLDVVREAPGAHCRRLRCRACGARLDGAHGRARCRRARCGEARRGQGHRDRGASHAPSPSRPLRWSTPTSSKRASASP